MERLLLLLVVIAIVSAGILAGGVGWFAGSRSGPVPGDYVLQPGECWVHPQGDPLYDAHYAQEVNPQNCTSYLTQEQANHVKAETRRVNTETTTMVNAVYSIFAVVGLLLVGIVYVVIRG